VDLKAEERVHSEGIEMSRAQGHDSRDQVRPAHCEHAREQPATTLPDDRDRSLAFRHILQPDLEAFEHPSGAADVPPDAAPVRAMARPA
jgi:hypothetical protein